MIPHPLTPAAQRARRDGCDCPPFVERCVHFNGRWVALHHFDSTPVVCTGSEPPVAASASHHGGDSMCVWWNGEQGLTAEAAFAAAVERLLAEARS